MSALGLKNEFNINEYQSNDVLNEVSNSVKSTLIIQPGLADGISAVNNPSGNSQTLCGIYFLKHIAKSSLNRYTLNISLCKT